jgi:hypothetical protein
VHAFALAKVDLAERIAHRYELAQEPLDGAGGRRTELLSHGAVQAVGGRLQVLKTE